MMEDAVEAVAVDEVGEEGIVDGVVGGRGVVVVFVRLVVREAMFLFPASVLPDRVLDGDAEWDDHGVVDGVDRAVRDDECEAVGDFALKAGGDHVGH